MAPNKGGVRPSSRDLRKQQPIPQPKPYGGK